MLFPNYTIFQASSPIRKPGPPLDGARIPDRAEPQKEISQRRFRVSHEIGLQPLACFRACSGSLRECGPRISQSFASTSLRAPHGSPGQTAGAVLSLGDVLEVEHFHGTPLPQRI